MLCLRVKALTGTTISDGIGEVSNKLSRFKRFLLYQYEVESNERFPTCYMTSLNHKVDIFCYVTPYILVEVY
jgi:hypothetical protein